MTYFLAWIIVGFCSYLITKNLRDRVLPKYHLAMHFLEMLEDTPSKYEVEKITPEYVASLHRGLEVMIGICGAIFAPFALWGAFQSLFAKNKYQHIQEACNSFAKRHGMVF